MQWGWHNIKGFLDGIRRVYTVCDHIRGYREDIVEVLRILEISYSIQQFLRGGTMGYLTFQVVSGDSRRHQGHHKLSRVLVGSSGQSIKGYDGVSETLIPHR